LKAVVLAGGLASALKKTSASRLESEMRFSFSMIASASFSAD